MKRWGIIGSGLLVIGLILFGIIAYVHANPRETAESRVQAAILEHIEATKAQRENSHGSSGAPQGSTQQDSKDPTAPQVSTDPAKAPEDSAQPAPQGYVSPVDFEDLWDMNSDIYAWLYIPGTAINYPILQRHNNDSYYLQHSSEGRSSKRGALFTEETYTSKDFTDPVTVVYGHRSSSGAMFGTLQSTYSTKDGFEAYRDIIIYLPEQELHYEIFAAVPHDMRHILYYNDFSDPEVFQAFLEQVFSVRSINANIDRSVEVTAEDQLLILSTCLRGDSDQRFLVLARRTGESSAP